MNASSNRRPSLPTARVECIPAARPQAFRGVAGINQRTEWFQTRAAASLWCDGWNAAVEEIDRVNAAEESR